MITDVNFYIRKLAKGDYYRSLYSLSKEMPSLHIFKNSIDFTDIQMNFLGYLSFYTSLYLDVALGDVEERVLENEIYEEAYMYYKSKCDKAKLNQRQTESSSEIPKPATQWIFKRPLKGDNKNGK